MDINSIEMVNWKCFEHKKVDFNRLTLLNWKNGEGKTSLIQAIVLCLFDKRPDNLDFASLVDTEKPTKLTLKFTHNAATYVVEREVGKTSGYRLYKNEELMARTSKECKAELSKIIPESVLTSLWGYEPLSVSNVLNSSYLYSILEKEFAESLDLRQYFVSDRSYYQKHKSTLEKQITNQKVTASDVDSLKKDLDEIEAKIREKAFVSDSDVVKAKKAKEDFAEYERLLSQLADSVPYDRELCLRLKGYGRTEEEFNNYFDRIQHDLDTEKNKASASPLTKYPRSTISSLINESKCNDNKCILCGGVFHEPKIDYDTIDNAKIQRLEKILEDRQYNFSDLLISMKYWHTKKMLSLVEYSKDFDFNSILNSYNAETNALYAEYERKKAEFTTLDKDLAQINELLKATEAYDKDKKCIEIVDEYIEQAKAYYATEIVKNATEIIKKINTRYTEILIENGVYKARLFDKDFTKESVLAVQSLSKGEKTMVALALILSIRNLFMPKLPLIMDESFANLDANNIEAIKMIIHEDSNQWIIVSHDERLI